MNQKDQKFKLNELQRSILKQWLGGGLLITLITIPLNGRFSWGGFVFDVFMNGLVWVVLANGNGYFIRKFTEHISWLEAPIKKLLYTIGIALVYTVAAYTVIHILVLRYKFDVPFDVGFRELKITNYYFVIVITIVIMSVLHGRQFLLAWRSAAIQTEQLKRANLASQFESLKSQVNPHFLFNSLNVLSTLVYKDQDMAAEFINQLSKVYRYVLEVQQKEMVSLSVERDALEAYVYLAQIRFGNNLTVNIDLPDEPGQMIPPLALQMLVENAIKHNIVSNAKPLKVDLSINDGHIEIKNNLQPKKQMVVSSGIGIKNIKERYQFLQDKAVEIIKTEDTFLVKLPLIHVEL